ncbi:hypothetical protein SAMN02990966_02041 [Rhodospirillales bacterium URHD0017]|nr:hypothetical protein SAMN02990966_02041 [Rhodospirillales bacterium URHD0017]
MKRRTSALAIVLAAVATMAAPSFAQDLSGEWQFKRKAREGYHTGTLVIDKDGQVRQRGRSPLQDYFQCGHVVAAGGKVEIVFTSVKSGRGYSIDHFYCTVQSESALSCFNIDGIGKEGDLFRLERTRRTQASPDGQMDDVCPARERPQV